MPHVIDRRDPGGRVRVATEAAHVKLAARVDPCRLGELHNPLAVDRIMAFHLAAFTGVEMLIRAVHSGCSAAGRHLGPDLLRTRLSELDVVAQLDHVIAKFLVNLGIVLL